jgi:hypothetical protein
MNTASLATFTIAAAAAVVASADAAFLGWSAFVRSSGNFTVVDVFAVTDTANHALLNVYDAQISTSNAGGFFQAAGLASKSWKPDLTSFTSTRDSIDSFMTVGASRFAGDSNVYAGLTTNGDPNFVPFTWNVTPSSQPANVVPALAGWYTGDPTSDTLRAEDLSAVAGVRQGAAGGFGIWAGHLVLNTLETRTISWTAFGTVKNLGSNTSQQLTFAEVFTVPAPGAIAVMGVAALASGRRRR